MYTYTYSFSFRFLFLVSYFSSVLQIFVYDSVSLGLQNVIFTLRFLSYVHMSTSLIFLHLTVWSEVLRFWSAFSLILWYFPLSKTCLSRVAGFLEISLTPWRRRWKETEFFFSFRARIFKNTHILKREIFHFKYTFVRFENNPKIITSVGKFENFNPLHSKLFFNYFFFFAIYLANGKYLKI